MTPILTDEEIGQCLPLGIAEFSTLVGKREITNYARAVADAVIEKCAEWYAEHGWLLDEEDVPAALRAMKGQG